MQDRLIVWLSVATAFVTFVALATVGLQPLALFGLVHVPAVLMLLLAARAVVCLARGEPTALRIGSRELLGGRLALVVPLLALTVWTVGRETGVFGANLALTRTTDQVSSNWLTNSGMSGPGIVGGIQLPEALRDATGITVTGDGSVPQQRAAAELRTLASQFAGHRVVGTIDLQMASPFALQPLWKGTDSTAHANCDVYLCDNAGTCHARISGTVDGSISCTMLGFASQRNFHEYLGTWLGKVTREQLTGQVQKFVARPR